MHSADDGAHIAQLANGWIVRIPFAGGNVCFQFEEVEQPKRHVLEAEVTVWDETPGARRDVFTGHLNTLSLSARETFRRGLDDAFGKSEWTNHLNRACALLRETWQSHDWSVNLEAITVEDEIPYLVPQLILEGLPTILFGPGETGKTYFTLALALGVCETGMFIGRQCRMGRVLMVDYEGTEVEVKRRLSKLGMTDFSGLIYWPGRGQPVSEMVPALSRAIAERDVALLVVDSAALAVGSDPQEVVAATGYFRALSRLGVSSLTIAHMTKDERDDRHPFGSIFWYNSARLVWNIKAAEDCPNPKHLGLFCRKSNEDVRHKPFGVELTFAEDGKVFVRREDLHREMVRHTSKPAQLIRYLSAGARSIEDIMEELDMKKEAAKKLVQRTEGVIGIGEPGREYRYGLVADRTYEG